MSIPDGFNPQDVEDIRRATLQSFNPTTHENISAPEPKPTVENVVKVPTGIPKRTVMAGIGCILICFFFYGILIVVNIAYLVRIKETDHRNGTRHRPAIV